MKKLVYDPVKADKRMTIVCFISGSGTNYREIVARNPDHHYLVFTNRPECEGISIARKNNHEVVELSHVPYLREARNKYGAGNIPRNCPERLAFEQDAVGLIESKLKREPDLICLAGYDQLNTDWMVDRYYPRILNVHPGDTTKGYDGLHWIASAKAILAGEEKLRSTLFFVDKGLDNGPVLVQSEPLDIVRVLTLLETGGNSGLIDSYKKIKAYATNQAIKTYQDFKTTAGEELREQMARICGDLQNALKVAGDWKIYPFGVHDLIAKGRVEVDEKTVYVDRNQMPVYGYRLEEHDVWNDQERS